ncbi:hypothetical protein NE237_027765 [Protea cynaroides]|uniref:GAG-pre-integrase domain-containing protein n=1 Tax=Protea cynaroides TaxID=273540 RepID=A0A9Q0GQS0_9MAGN|nr:hypothetical protein NE237_027765 [Protea cynaroides]
MFDGITHIIFGIRHVPDLQKSLLLLGKFDEDGFKITLENDRLKIVKRALIMAKRELMGGLYRMIGDTMVGEAIVAYVVIESATIWHGCLGHINMQRLKLLLNRGLLLDFKSKNKDTSSSDLLQMFELKSLKEVQNQFEEQLIDTDGDDADGEYIEPGAKTQGDKGRTKKTKNPPVSLKDYVTTYACIIEEHEPCTYRQACESNDALQWRTSMEEEMEALYKKRLGILSTYLMGERLLVASGSTS